VKRGWLCWTIVANLLVLVGLAFAYPQLMISPGPLVAGHTELATDCFACHTAWQGATAQKCTSCHALPDIGLRTPNGTALPQRGLKTSFHQQLSEQNCMACHSDHAGPKLTKHSRKPFSHALLLPAARQDCETCHAKPTNTMHSALTVDCVQCHQTDAWKPATFAHATLAQDTSWRAAKPATRRPVTRCIPRSRATARSATLQLPGSRRPSSMRNSLCWIGTTTPLASPATSATTTVATPVMGVTSTRPPTSGANTTKKVSSTWRIASSATAVPAVNTREAGVKGVRVGTAASVIDLPKSALPPKSDVRLLSDGNQRENRKSNMRSARWCATQCGRARPGGAGNVPFDFSRRTRSAACLFAGLPACIASAAVVAQRSSPRIDKMSCRSPSRRITSR